MVGGQVRRMFAGHKNLRLIMRIMPPIILCCLFANFTTSYGAEKNCCSNPLYIEQDIEPPIRMKKMEAVKSESILDHVTPTSKIKRVDQVCLSECLLKNYPENFCIPECSIR